MANKIVNSAIEFAYASETPENELKKELEKYFLYQNIVVLDQRYECGELVEKLTSKTKCKFSVIRNFESIEEYENIGAVVCVNNHSSNRVKMFCKEHSIPFIYILTKICDSSNFKPYYYDDDMVIHESLYPLGIIFDLGRIDNFKFTISEAITEVSSLSFDILQSKLENMFFGIRIDYDFLNNQQKLIQSFQIIVQGRKNNPKVFLKSIIQLYLSYLLVCARSQFNVEENLLCLYLKENQYNQIQIKNAFRSIILSIEKNFFVYYTSTFMGTINYKIHQSKLNSYGYKSNPYAKQLATNKIDFILSEFRSKLLNYVSASIDFEATVKNILADIDIDNLYSAKLKLKDSKITDFISLEPNVFNSQNFLTILYQLGLLNYTF